MRTPLPPTEPLQEHRLDPGASLGQHPIHNVAQMSHLNLLSLARDFRVRAKEILSRAETMHDPDTRQKIREVAAGYEKLAQRVEQQSGEAEEA